MSNRKGAGRYRAQLLQLEAKLSYTIELDAQLRRALATEQDPHRCGELAMRLQLTYEDRQRLERQRRRMARKQVPVPGALSASDYLVEWMQRSGITPQALERSCSLTMSEVLDLMAGRKMTERQAGALEAAGLSSTTVWRNMSGGFAPD